MKSVTIQYYAILREKRGLDEEIIETKSENLRQLYEELKDKYHFELSIGSLKVALNNEFSDWKHVLNSGDNVVFIPPVSGG